MRSHVDFSPAAHTAIPMTNRSTIRPGRNVNGYKINDKWQVGNVEVVGIGIKLKAKSKTYEATRLLVCRAAHLPDAISGTCDAS